MKSEPRYFLKVGKLSLRASEELRRRVSSGEDEARVTVELLLREKKAIPGQPDEGSTSSGDKAAE